jgi:prophage regulatory protein
MSRAGLPPDSTKRILEDYELLSRLCSLQARLLEQSGLNQSPGERLLRLPEVARRTGLSASSVYRLERMGRFPHRQRIGLRSSAWRESDLTAWLQNPKTWFDGKTAAAE